MSLNGQNQSAFETTFGARASKGNGIASRNNQANIEDRPKAEFWINVGYQAHFTNPESGEEEVRFIALPMGMPLDTQKPVAVNGSSEIFRALRSAQNDLLEQLKARAEKMEPGEELIIGEGQLVIQLRRVKEEAAPISQEVNPLSKKLEL